jgi:hypothetical protein
LRSIWQDSANPFPIVEKPYVGQSETAAIFQSETAAILQSEAAAVQGKNSDALEIDPPNLTD